jgi:UDP-N-acetylglucosamine 2-epimerase
MGLKIYIMTDMEGSAGVLNSDDYCHQTSRHYEVGRELTTLETNAAIEGALAAGATDILVVDGHGQGAINPLLLHSAARLLAGRPRLHLVEPLDYPDFVAAMLRADLILTDSGGVQEEAPALGKPVLVVRDVTERPEAVAAGVVELIGTDENRILERVSRLLNDPAAYAAMARAVSPYGDGHASRRIVAFLQSQLADGLAALDTFRPDGDEAAIAELAYTLTA